MKIGIFGGTFNPPHNTHVAMASAAMEQLRLDKLFVLPCGDPPHKHCDVDADIRLTLCRLAFGDIAEVDDYEVVKRGKSYTVETLRHYRELYPDAQLYLIIGGDSLLGFHKWYLPEEIARLASLAVVCRKRRMPASVARRIEQRFGAEVNFLRMEPTSLSSTELRLRYEFGMDNGEFVPQAVDEYVRDRQLYCKYRAMTDKLRQYLTPQRFEHTFYVVKRGQELAAEEEKDKAFVACLLHDCAKYIPKRRYSEYGYVQPDDMPDSVVHSFLGAKVAERDFGITDDEILDAIAYHTTGRPAMTRLDKIVYVADKTEDSRPYPLSHLKRGDLDRQFVACLKEAYAVCLERHCDSVCPLSEQTINYYCDQKTDKSDKRRKL